MLTSLCHASAQNCSRLQREIYSFPCTHQKVGILLFAVTVFPAGSISEEKESFTLLFLLRIGNSYHGRNSIGNSKSYLCFFKEYKGRTGRRERGLKKIWENFIKGIAVQRWAIQAFPMLKMLFWGRVGKALKMQDNYVGGGYQGRLKYSSTCAWTEKIYR